MGHVEDGLLFLSQSEVQGCLRREMNGCLIIGEEPGQHKCALRFPESVFAISDRLSRRKMKRAAKAAPF